MLDRGNDMSCKSFRPATLKRQDQRAIWERRLLEIHTWSSKKSPLIFSFPSPALLFWSLERLKLFPVTFSCHAIRRRRRANNGKAIHPVCIKAGGPFHTMCVQNAFLLHQSSLTLAWRAMSGSFDLLWKRVDPDLSKVHDLSYGLCYFILGWCRGTFVSQTFR
jgi:hypothetical protein